MMYATPLVTSRSARLSKLSTRAAPVRAAPEVLSNGSKLASASAAMLLAAAVTASSAMAYDVELGVQTFTGNCAACHTGGNNIVEAPKTLKKEALEQYLAGGFNVEAIKYQVENGKGGMPAWKDRLDDDEIEAVANYVYETAFNNAW